MRPTVGTLLVLMLLLAGLGHAPPSLDEAQVVLVEGRQMEDVNCTGMTFEDLFAYDNATFDVAVDGSWSAASITATARASDQRAADVRADLDGLFDGFPGGNDSWISTDERDAVREVGPSCIADMSTRITLHEGASVRTIGEDANEVRFVEDGLALDERDLIPSDHPDYRTCPRPFASSSCREVPVSATQALEIDLMVAEDATANAAFERLEDPDGTPFTIAIVATNMTNASMRLTFPSLAGLTLVGSEVQDDGNAVLNQDAPLVGQTSDGRLQVDLNLTYPLDEWPMERVLYLDFTTEDLSSNSAPEWLTDAPDNGTRFSLPPGINTATIAASDVAGWGFDQHGWSLSCEGAEGWNVSRTNLGTVVIARGDGLGGDVTCGLVDGYGMVSDEHRTWSIVQPFTFDANLTTERHVLVEVNPAAEAGFTLAATLEQGTRSGAVQSMPVLSTTVFDHSSEGMLPGSLSWSVRISGNGWWIMEFLLDIDVVLPNAAPSLSIEPALDGSNGTWNALGTSALVRGYAVDPEGESLTVMWRLCGAGDEATLQGEAWEADVKTIACDQQGINTYVVEITATDASGGETSISASLDPPVAEVPEPVSPPAEEPQSRSFIPHPGLFASVLCLAIAAVLSRPSDP